MSRTRFSHLLIAEVLNEFILIIIVIKEVVAVSVRVV